MSDYQKSFFSNYPDCKNTISEGGQNQDAEEFPKQINAEITLNKGPYGLYLKYNEKNFSVPKGTNIEDINEDFARLLVASSKISIGAFFKIARAIAILCLWPPLTLTPRSPTTELYPFFIAMISSLHVDIKCKADKKIKNVLEIWMHSEHKRGCT